VGHRKESVLRKLGRIDYGGTAIFISSVAAILIALTYAGSTHPWTSWRTILPLVLGFSGLLIFMAYEESPFCIEPTMPLRLFKHRTTVIACILGFLHFLLNVWIIYFLPIYFQGVFGSSPAKSGVQLLPVILFLIPFAAISGRLLQQFGRYRPLAVGGLSLIVVGLGLFTLLKASSSIAAWVLFQALEAAGIGLALSALLPSAQASLDDADTAKITETFSVIRSLGISFAVTVPGAIFNSCFDSLTYRISDTLVRARLVDGQAYEHTAKSFI
jgi:Na+/melibiose symporter-like transporter